MLDAVKNGFGKRAVITAELVIPSTGVILRAEDRGRFLPTSVQQFKDVMLFRFGGFEQQPFIDDQENRGGIFSLDFFIGTIVRAMSSSRSRSGRRIYLVL